ncbi:MAG TPA: thrombospondin type 3 repeat-containing protein [Candidatus Saccharimonadales bacterium]|nr:thrombospondin type 3 repeat-containing protein [Candidatus Saccharimonadales bacterium]
MKLYCTLLIALALLANAASAATTINPANKYSYGANIGWIDWRGDTNSGAVIGEYACSGFIYSANVGWINLGSGNPTNGIQYLNAAGTDFGVNQDGLGNLRGYAYGANIGWINFENVGAPKVDLLTGKLSGYAYSANCGWISLSNASAFVQTDAIPRGPDSNGNGLPDAWERTYFGTLGVNPNADADGDGMSNLQEYQAGTNPTNASDSLRITRYSFASGGTLAGLTWTSVPTRYYYIWRTPTLGPSTWTDSGLGLIAPDGLNTTRSFSETSLPTRFFRVQAVRPLTP